MTRGEDEGKDAADERLSDAYRDSVGSVMAARTLYDQACATHGADSRPAKQAQEHLARTINHRNELRRQYDQVIDQRPRH